MEGRLIHRIDLYKGKYRNSFEHKNTKDHQCQDKEAPPSSTQRGDNLLGPFLKKSLELNH